MAKFSREKKGTVKQISGFSDDVIYIVKGNSFDVKDSLKESGARFRRDFGWYYGDFAKKPSTLPSGLSLIELRWEEVGNEDGSLKNADIVKKAIESKLYDEDPSEYVGSIGERLDISVVVASKREFVGAYGTQFCYNFRDENENSFTWFTSVGSKTQFEEGEECDIRGTVKGFDEFRNCKSTILTRVNRKK